MGRESLIIALCFTQNMHMPEVNRGQVGNMINVIKIMFTFFSI